MASKEALRILENVADLPKGRSLTLSAIDNSDGYGGCVVLHSRSGPYVFQREGYQGRSRWADNLSQALEEIEAWVNTGRLHEPDKIVGF